MRLKHKVGMARGVANLSCLLFIVISIWVTDNYDISGLFVFISSAVAFYMANKFDQWTKEKWGRRLYLQEEGRRNPEWPVWKKIGGGFIIFFGVVPPLFLLINAVSPLIREGNWGLASFVVFICLFWSVIFGAFFWEEVVEDILRERRRRSNFPRPQHQNIKSDSNASKPAEKPAAPKPASKPVTAPKAKKGKAGLQRFLEARGE